MDIPDWFKWIFLGLAFLQVFGLVSVIRRLRELDAEVRAKARFDLVDSSGTILFLGGAYLSLEASESWFWLGLAGLALVGTGYAVKGVHLLRARRHPTA
ncbi:hypothetical protein ACIRJR_36900 [Streptomyces sp. NPDC102402]|uniref:hypothetical protein n=1 Tax=Streptomyces sp. NPDC102402 TaxID=3366169 RepID=UPI0037FE14B2